MLPDTLVIYLQANLLLRNFRHCSDDVKCAFFQTCCTNMYCCQLWFNSIKSSTKKLSTSYNSVLRRLLCISKPYHASNMFVSRGLPTFVELLQKSIYRFTKRIESSSNSIIGACLSPLMFISSPIRKLGSSISALEHVFDILQYIITVFIIIIILYVTSPV